MLPIPARWFLFINMFETHTAKFSALLQSIKGSFFPKLASMIAWYSGVPSALRRRARAGPKKTTGTKKCQRWSAPKTIAQPTNSSKGRRKARLGYTAPIVALEMWQTVR